VFDWLRESALPYTQFMQINGSPIVFALLGLLSIFFLVSRRANARAEPGAPALRLLSQLAQACLSEKRAGLHKVKRGLAWLLQKTDRLLYDKLKLLPDVCTGRRLNFFLLLFATLPGASYEILMTKGNTVVDMFASLRHSGESWSPEARNTLFWLLLGTIPFLLKFALPFLFVHRNREFYFDIFALYTLITVNFFKLAGCWTANCCFGIPWPWGIYNEVLDTTVFPIQIFEVAVGFLASVLCVLYILYAKSYRPGRGCSLCALLHLVPRFYWDYLRYHGEGYRSLESEAFLGFTTVQMVCIVFVVAAIIWLFVLPLEKKWMDRLWLFAARHLRRLAVKAYFHPRLHPFLLKHLAWCENIAALEGSAGANLF